MSAWLARLAMRSAIVDMLRVSHAAFAAQREAIRTRLLSGNRAAIGPRITAAMCAAPICGACSRRPAGGGLRRPRAGPQCGMRKTEPAESTE
jgi:hypothetical protein